MIVRRVSDRRVRGFVIVPVLWILLALSSLAGILAVYLSNSAIAVAVNDDRLRATALANASLELTAYKMSLQPKDKRPVAGSFAFVLDRSRIVVTFSTESGRIDLNLAPKAVLQNLFQVLGAEPKEAAAYADRIAGWRTKPKNEALDSEPSLYRSAGLSYGPRGGPFANVQELWLVLDLPPAMVERMMPFVTVFAGQREITLLAAPPEVLASLPGMTPAAIERLLKEREGVFSDPKALIDELGLPPGIVSTKAGDALRVRTQIEFDNGRRSSIETVIALNPAVDPYQVLAWSDDSETGAIGGAAR